MSFTEYWTYWALWAAYVRQGDIVTAMWIAGFVAKTVVVGEVRRAEKGVVRREDGS